MKLKKYEQQTSLIVSSTEKFVLENGNPTVSKLIVLWNYWNKEFFDNAFKACPIMLLAEPSRPSVLGDYSAVGAYGNRAQIRIRPSLMSGTHPHTLPGDEYEKGRFLFVADVALHETIHLWQDEVQGDLEPAYHGHGPLFRDKCNEIGEKLGLPPVRTCKKRGKDAELPSCSHFPHNVRPDDYYQGAYVREHEEPRPLKGRLERLLKDFTGEEIVQELKAMGVLETRHGYGGQDGNLIENLRAVSIADVLQTEEDLSIVEHVVASGEQASLKHEWFIQAFQTACLARGISPDLRIDSSLSATLDAWLDEKLTRGSYFGAKFYTHEKQSSLREKLCEIVAQWEFIEISVLGQRVEVPSVPDLEFLVSYREKLFDWITEQRMRKTEAIMDRLQLGGQC